jgi:hypothetical protein
LWFLQLVIYERKAANDADETSKLIFKDADKSEMEKMAQLRHLSPPLNARLGI